MNNEYVDHPCIYCNKQRMRHKLRKDWSLGEKLGRGYYPDQHEYWFCTWCRGTCCTKKGVFFKKLEVKKNGNDI